MNRKQGKCRGKSKLKNQKAKGNDEWLGLGKPIC